MEAQEDLKMTTTSSKSNAGDVVDNSTEATAKESELSNIDSETEIFDRIASKLLRSGFLLTALELHAELVERGKESSRLRDYFDNPHNFEKHFDISPTNRPSTSNEMMTTTMFPKNVSIEPTPSENTFDSLDSTHYSDEDLERHIGDERIAVLEFELRKARQTIDSLRASLTMTTTGQCSDMIDNNKLLNECEPPPPVNNDDIFINSNNESRFTEYSNEFSRDFYYRGSADGDSCPGEDDKFSKKSTNLSYESCGGG
ncbi:lisH domain and HEAT repeat-containing protein KIAA1468-like, partial [Euroglyphus maynei]